MTNSIQIIAPRGNTIAVTAAGSGKSVILLHGFPLDWRMWQRQFDDLSARFHVLAIDFRGFGGSTLDDDGFGLADLASDVEFVRQHLANEQAIALVGLSMGGYVAFEYWRSYSQHLAALVLSNTKPQTDSDEAKASRLKMADEALRLGTWPAVCGMLPRLLSEQTLHGASVITDLVTAMMRSVNPNTIAAAQRAMAARRDFVPELPRIRVPTLVITGQNDAISSPESNRAWSPQIPGSRLEIVANTGHLPQLEAPEMYNAKLLTFLDSIL